MISIIIPNYNKVTLIEETLQSICNQTYSDWECIIVDDHSTDDSLLVIKKFISKDIRFSLKIRPDDLPKGPSTCRNIGIEHSKGDYVIFLDSDDLLVSFCLETRITAFKNNIECDFLVFQMERFKTIPNSIENKELEISNHNNYLLYFLKMSSIWQVTSPIYKTQFLKKIEGFNTQLRSFEDLELAVKSIFNASSFLVFNNIDSFYRNDEHYKTKYNAKSQLDIVIKSYKKYLESIHKEIILKIIDIDMQKSYQNALVFGYKKIFTSIILLNGKDYYIQNKWMVDFFIKNKYTTVGQNLKFNFVKNILLKLPKIKGLGIYRLINFLYK